MLFNSGNPNLVAQSRLYADDPSTAAQPQWSTQRHKDAINVAYLQLRDLARLIDVGFARKRAYADGVAADDPSDAFYALPADFAGRLRVEISTNGSDLSTTLPADQPSIKVLEVVSWDAAMDAYNLGVETSARYTFIHDQHFGIFPPLSATEAGTKSIRITYEASSVELSGDTDEPDLPRPYHDLIAMRSAINLRMSKDLPIRDLERRYELGVIQFRRAVYTSIEDKDKQMSVAGRNTSRRRRRIRQGSVRRI